MEKASNKMGLRGAARRTAAGILCAAMLTAVCPIAAAADGVVTDTASIGGGTAHLVYVTMGGNRTADVALANGSVHSDTAADTLVQSVAGDGNSTVVAAINGGFFNSYYSGGAKLSFPDNCPRIYSTVIKDGNLVNGVGETNMLGVTWDGKPYIDHVKYQCTMLLNSSVELGVWAVNQYFTDSRSISLFTGEFTLPVTVPASCVVMTIRDGRVAAIAGGGTYQVPAGAQLLVYNADAAADAKKWNQFPAVGDTAVAVTSAASCKRSADLAAWQNMKTVIAGGRMLLQNTYDVTGDTAYNAEFDGDSKQSADGSAQRSFAAVMQDGRLLLGTANASFRQIAAWLKAAGAVNAVSLDGGASSMLYVSGSGYLTTAGRRLASAFVIVDESVREQKPETPVVTPSAGSTLGLSASDPSDWAAESVTRGAALGIIPDWLQNNYRANITRREFCVLIVTLLEKKSGKAIDVLRQEAKKEYAGAFNDTDDYYVRECASLGIVNGADGNFRPSDSLSRQEAAAILQRTAQALGASAAGSGKTFADAAQIESWAVEAVSFVTAAGIMNGEGASFNPAGTFTREQAYITMVNTYEHL